MAFQKLKKRWLLTGFVMIVPPKWLCIMGNYYQGLTLYPFIFLTDRNAVQNARLMNHEYIHIRQQLECGVFPFYILYFLHYIYNLFIYKKHQIAYLNIFFEKEAYANEKNLYYLKERKLWASFYYL